MTFFVRVLQILAVFVVLLALAILFQKCDKEAYAAEPLGETNTQFYVKKLLFRDGAIPSNDIRRDIVMDVTTAIDQAAHVFGLDPAMIASNIYAESGFFPNVVGASHGEQGLMQVHGRARRLCEMSKLDLTKPSGQIMCGSRWLRYVIDHCGGLVADREKCIESKGKNTRACAGGISAYLSGQCIPTKRVGWKVQRRLKLANWAKSLQ